MVKSNYELLKKYDDVSITHNWIYIKDIHTEQTGLALLSKDDKVAVYMGDNEDSSDSIISQEDFNKDYIITSITNHFGIEIKNWNK